MKIFMGIVLFVLTVAVMFMLGLVCYNIGHDRGLYERGEWYQVTDTVKHWQFKPKQ